MKTSRPEKEKREDAGKECPCGKQCVYHKDNWPTDKEWCLKNCHKSTFCHPTPRPSQEAKKNPYDRWEKGTPHLPLSKAIYDVIEKMDFENGDSFCWKSGGDGDNGENLMYLLDEMLDTPGNPIALALDHAKAEERERVETEWLTACGNILRNWTLAPAKETIEAFEYFYNKRKDARSALSLARKEEGK